MRSSKNSWTAARQQRDVRRCVVDLSNVTAIDDRGEKMLKTMKRAGAEFLATDVYTKHVIDVISRKYKKHGSLVCIDKIPNQHRPKLRRKS